MTINLFILQTNKSPMFRGGTYQKKTMTGLDNAHLNKPQIEARGVYIQSYSGLHNEFKENLEYINKPYYPKRNQNISMPYTTRWVKNNENTFQLRCMHLLKMHT